MRVGAIALCLILSAEFIAEAQREFRQTTNGDWQTTVVHSDGTREQFVFSPPNKFIATVQGHTKITDVKAGKVRYDYVVRNDSRSVQSITTFLVGIGPADGELTLANATVPGGWDAELWGTVNSGIRPGESAEFAGEGTGYPGALDLDLCAFIDMNADYPEDLTERQLDEFSTLRGASVRIRGIGPRFRADSVTSMSDFVAIAQHYLKEFKDSRHPAASQLERALVGMSTRKADDVFAAIQAAATSPAGANPWHTSLSEGLLVCIELARSALQPK